MLQFLTRFFLPLAPVPSGWSAAGLESCCLNEGGEVLFWEDMQAERKGGVGCG